MAADFNSFLLLEPGMLFNYATLNWITLYNVSILYVMAPPPHPYDDNYEAVIKI